MKINIASNEIIHFIGIGGIGMSGLAQIMKNMGFKNLECIFMDASFSLTDRPENLSINQWIEISSIYKNQDR